MEVNQGIGDEKYPDLERNERTVTESNAFNDFDQIVSPFDHTVGEGMGQGIAYTVFMIQQGPDSLFHKAGNKFTGIVTCIEEPVGISVLYGVQKILI